MKTRLLIALLLFAAALPQVTADEWSSEPHLCALTIPTQESWTTGPAQALPSGKVILHAVSMQSNEGIMVTFVPEMPSTDLRDPEMEKRIQELLILQGWTLESGMEVAWQGRPFLQFIARRKDAVSGMVVSVIRATVRAGDLYVVTAYGKGDANRANDPKFLRIMDTFRFTTKRAPVADTTTGSEHRLNLFALVGSATAVGLLIAAFAVTIFLSRHGIEGSP